MIGIVTSCHLGILALLIVEVGVDEGLLGLHEKEDGNDT
jgi:hypothetical protein